MSVGLTDSQRDVMLAIQRYLFDHDGVGPSFADIAAGAGLRSKGNLQATLEALEARGYIRRHPRKRRAIEVLQAIPDPSKKGARARAYKAALTDIAEGAPQPRQIAKRTLREHP